MVDKWLTNGIDTYHISDDCFEIYNSEGPVFSHYTEKPDAKAAAGDVARLIALGYREV